jgi:hypothetical protein
MIFEQLKKKRVVPSHVLLSVCNSERLCMLQREDDFTTLLVQSEVSRSRFHKCASSICN